METVRKPQRRLVVLLIALVLLIGMITSALPAAGAAAETLAQWKPGAAPAGALSYAATEATAANAAAALSLSNGGNITGVGTGTGTNPYAYTYNAWQSGALWWQLSALSTLGYNDISLSFSVQSSNTGPLNFALEYSVNNGADWLAVTNAALPVTYSSPNAYTPLGPYTLPVAAENCAALSLRFRNTDTVSVGGGATAAGGTSRISNIVLSGVSGPKDSLAEWRSPTVTDVITATDGAYQGSSTLKIVGTTATTLNWANSAINRAGGFDGKAATAYWLFSTSSAGYKNIQVSGSIRSSATGPRDFTLQYSSDGSVWQDAVDAAIVVGNALGINDTASQFSKQLPGGADNASTLYVRLLLASNTSARGDDIASGGTNSINNIVISGEYLLAAGQLLAPRNDTPSGAVPLGQVISFSADPQDEGVAAYAVLVSADNGATWNAAPGGLYTLSTLPATLQVKAVAPGQTDSRVTTYSYTQAKLPLVTASKNSGALIPGATVALENAVAGATILYKINGGAAQTYSGALTLAEALFIGDPATLTLEAWAEKSGYISGDTLLYTYSKAASGGERVYFGQLHSHTTNSDGVGSLAEAYAYAKNVAGLSFFAVTDHSNSLGETGSNSDNPAIIDLNTYNAGSAKWQAGLQAAANAATADFISCYGYEMTWSGGPGHINTFNTGGFVSRNNSALNSKTNDAGLRAYYELLTRNPQSISMFNHPGTTFGNFTNFAYYDPVIDQRISLVEVGNGEGAVSSGGYWRSYEQYTLALDKGWHVAPANNQDNHLGKWGDSNTCRTAIWTNDLSLNGVYQALRDMRVYATEVADLQIVYQVNGQPLGSVIDVVPPAATFTAEIGNPTAGHTVKAVSLVTNGGAEIQKDTPNTPNYSYNKTINNPAAGYYYLKVIVATPQGERIAVTAPVWLGRGKAAGFSGLSCGAVMPVTGEPLTISASLFNNELQGATLLSLEYKEQNGHILGSFPGLDLPIAAAGELSHSLTYTPATPGATTVTVSALIKFADNSELTYTYDIAYTVWDAAKLVYIGIDASHNNAYVNGNYKDSMGNFITLAAEYGARVAILDSGAALLAAAENPKYQMLILNAPDRHTSVTEKKYYSVAELAALTAFAQRGGLLIVAGLADYTEIAFANAEADQSRHMAGQQNQILAAIGSALRLADDQASDTVYNRNSSTQYAMELKDEGGSYNWGSPLLAGVSAAQVYSQFSGSTIFAVNESARNIWNAQPSPSIPSSVVPVISTSVNGISDDNDGSLGPGKLDMSIAKYGGKYLVMAAETLQHASGQSSQVIVAGGAFMSNFEVKVEMDNASTLQFSNYDICCNLIRSIIPAPPITAIADARKLPEGTTVTIEGIATTNVYSADEQSNTGFFDCIYVQDDSGGLNLFPVSAGVAEGQKIQVTGKLSSYQGETQLAVSKLQVVEAGFNKLAPQNMSTQAAMDPAHTGLLLKLSGAVSDVIKTGATVSQFTLTDSSGQGALIYINSYITSAVDLSFVREGAQVEVIGLASIGENHSGGDPLPRIRVRDRGEITLKTVYNYSVYLEPNTTSLNVGETLAVDVVLAGNINYTTLAAEIEYDENLLQCTGYENLQGFIAACAPLGNNKVALRSVPTSNMVTGASCSPPLTVVTLKFTVKDNFAGESATARLGIGTAIVNPPAGYLGTTIAPGQVLNVTLHK